MAKISMERNETKKCKIIPKKYNFIPDLLLQNKRIEEETIMEINKAEICRAMSLADVYMINPDGTETLLDPLNFYLKEETKDEEGDTDSKPEVVQKAELQSLITECEALTEEDYTVDSWAAFSTKLASAKAVNDDVNANQEAVTTATNELKTAKTALAKVQTNI